MMLFMCMKIVVSVVSLGPKDSASHLGPREGAARAPGDARTATGASRQPYRTSKAPSPMRAFRALGGEPPAPSARTRSPTRTPASLPLRARDASPARRRFRRAASRDTAAERPGAERGRLARAQLFWSSGRARRARHHDSVAHGGVLRPAVRGPNARGASTRSPWTRRRSRLCSRTCASSRCRRPRAGRRTWGSWARNSGSRWCVPARWSTGTRSRSPANAPTAPLTKKKEKEKETRNKRRGASVTVRVTPSRRGG